jgi:peptide/nickel transport system permease protein
VIGFILRRLLQLVPVVLIASVGIWAIIYAIPGGPVAAMLGDSASPEQVRLLTAQLGLDRPIMTQYVDWLRHALAGDLGLSLQSHEPVLGLIAQRLPATVQLGVAAMSVGLVIGVPAAVASALQPGSVIDRALSLWGALTLGVPTFWVGILLILLFAVQLHWLPSAAAYVPFWQAPLRMAANTALPALSLGLYVSGIFARFLRASLLRELNADYVRTARSKGLRRRAIVIGHVLPNALLPFVTVVGLMLASFIGGALVTEAVFTYPGLGRLLVQAINARDYPLIQGCILAILFGYVLINLVVDLLYAYIDPRTS